MFLLERKNHREQKTDMVQGVVLLDIDNGSGLNNSQFYKFCVEFNVDYSIGDLQ